MGPRMYEWTPPARMSCKRQNMATTGLNVGFSGFWNSRRRCRANWLAWINRPQRSRWISGSLIHRSMAMHGSLTRLHPLEPAELEMLDRAPRCAMGFREIVDEHERRAECFRKALRIMALHGKAAAFLRTIKREGADDHLAARGGR